MCDMKPVSYTHLHKDGHRCNSRTGGKKCCFNKHRNGCKGSKQQADQMCDGTAGFTDCNSHEKMWIRDRYHAAELKGKPAVFKCTVNEIKVKELPEADDEFAKDVSEFDTLAEYKDCLLYTSRCV